MNSYETVVRPILWPHLNSCQGSLKMENRIDPVLVKQRKLANGMVVSFYDLSKKIAGDRWQLRLKCEAVLPLARLHLEQLSSEEPVLQKYLRECFSENIRHCVMKNRTFVDEKDKDAMFAQLCEEVSAHTLSYVGSSAFPDKLFERQLEKFKKEYVVKREMELLAQADEVEEPADFSACFQD